MSVTLPDCPPSLRSIQHYLKTASEHDARDVVVAYWCRLHALQVGLKITSKKTPEETKLLMGLMDWLEEIKKSQKDNDAITQEVAAQAHLENYALKVFLYADKQDREQNYGKNVVKAFYTAGMIYDVLTTFGELTEEAAQNRKYAKWKAAYIHNCLKNGETPVPGPMQEDNENADPDVTANTNEGGTPTGGFTTPQNPNPTIGYTPDAGGFTPAPAGGFGPSGGLGPSGGFGSSGGFGQTGGFSPVVTDSNPVPPVVPSNFNSTLPDPALVNRLPPVPYTPDPNPGGFVPYEPSSVATPATTYGDNTGCSTLSPDQINKAKKYCKWANSALDYDDVKTAIQNLSSALQLLQTGRDPA